MKLDNAIKKYEIRQTRQIAAALIEIEKSKFNWRIIVFPFGIYDFIRYTIRLRVLRKNLFFTRKFALAASSNIHQGKERAWEIRQIEIKTREILDKEKKGFYTDKIRNKQLKEIEFLVDYHLDLLSSNQPGCKDAIKARYTSKGSYLTFLNSLQKVEEEVIQAALTTMRKGTKKERRLWFDKVRAATKKIRMEEADKLYSKTRS
ncbi:hypothetical protein D1BOALGB6SA_9477 [Olavius sp. associated proteobacterium Delta 1]|nr:hypothetical protein D1BOALGB6SA_9477 [Olavius sp. associated proteobacterium Delta 1]